jgi:Protein of unknown function (DUF1091)
MRENHLRPKSKWMLTSRDVVVDVCQLTENSKNPVLKAFMPGIMDTLGQFIHPCPYEGLFVANNVTFTSSTFLQMLPKGTKIRTEIALSDIKYMTFATLYMFNQVL